MVSAKRALWPALVIPLSMILGAGLVILANQIFGGGTEAEVPVLPPSQPVVPEPVPEPTTVAPRGDLSGAEETTIAVYRNASPSVVFITKLSVQMDPFRRNVMTIPAGTGSGFVWDDQGHIVTNYHVVAGGQGARVTLDDQTVWPAQLVGTYPDKDIAVLKIDCPAEKLRPLPVGESSDLQVGQHVFAIGNPFGLDHTLSTGVISGLGREIMSMSRRPIQGVIQTDAAINPGNSGGPLLDRHGRVVGINTQIISRSGSNAGVGLAVPINIAKMVVPELIANGKYEYSWLGISGAPVSPDIAKLMELPDGTRGALVITVNEDSPAENGGLTGSDRTEVVNGIQYSLGGDTIIGIDGSKVRDMTDLIVYLTNNTRPGDEVRLQVLHQDGVSEDLPIILGTRPGDG